MINETFTRGPILRRDTTNVKKLPAMGLGDAIASVATPIARALHLPCIDPATNQLRPESGCAKRKAKFNQAIPNINPFNDKSS